ncbi:MAG: ribonuclease J [Thermoleophilia bacterium]|nr:ribonuclease J [Thermoleophilia bacterium]
MGMSMTENVKIAQNLGYLDFDPDVVIPVENALNMKADKVVLMVTGSQGEPSSILGRLATGTNRRFEIQKGDTVVLSSHPIPGNEEMVYRVVNKLLQQDADVIYEAVAPIHVSGHASQEEMKLMLHLVNPKYLIPIHGELRMLKQHAKLATEIGIPEDNIALVENGQVIEFTDGKMNLGKRIPGGYVFVDGTGVGDVDRSVVREREVLGSNGIVLVNLTLNKNSGKLLDTEIITRGFMLSEDAGTITGMLKEKIARQAGNSNGNIQRDVQNLVKSFIFDETKRRPVVFVTIART